MIDIVTVDWRRFNQSNIPLNNSRDMPSVLRQLHISLMKAASLAVTKAGFVRGPSRSLAALNTGTGMAVSPYSSTRYLISSK